MNLFYRVFADVIVAIHFGYVTFVILGLLLILVGGLRRWRWVTNFWFRAIHFLMIAIVVGEAWLGIVCPLTIWENNLRELSGDVTYSGGFIANVLHNAMFFDAEPWVFTLCYTLFAFVVLLTLLFAPPRLRAPRPK